MLEIYNSQNIILAYCKVQASTMQNLNFVGLHYLELKIRCLLQFFAQISLFLHCFHQLNGPDINIIYMYNQPFKILFTINSNRSVVFGSAHSNLPQNLPRSNSQVTLWCHKFPVQLTSFVYQPQVQYLGTTHMLPLGTIRVHQPNVLPGLISTGHNIF